MAKSDMRGALTSRLVAYAGGKSLKPLIGGSNLG
jgi:hypothetical protein